MTPTTPFPTPGLQDPRPDALPVLARHLGEPLTGGHRIALLQDMTGAFAAIDAARDHVNIESCLTEADGPGESLSQRLLAACERGVKVNLLFDGFGSPATSHRCFERLSRAGATLCEVDPTPRWRPWLAPSSHLRNHHPLIVVDGRIGFIGGVELDAARNEGCRDLHLHLEGPIVQHLQRLFIGHWQRHSTTSLPLARYHPPLAAAGTQRAALAAREAGRRSKPHGSALLAAVGAARERVWLSTAHRVPPQRLLIALLQAAERGVQVEVRLPGDSDDRASPRAGRKPCERLLQAGVRILECLDRRPHAKSCVVDGAWCSVAITTPDRRSALHDAEAHLVVLDEGFARRLETVLREDLGRARPIDAGTWRRRPLWQRARDMLTCRIESPP